MRRAVKILLITATILTAIVVTTLSTHIGQSSLLRWCLPS
jgi:hypothetical protein